MGHEKEARALFFLEKNGLDHLAVSLKARCFFPWGSFTISNKIMSGHVLH